MKVTNPCSISVSRPPPSGSAPDRHGGGVLICVKSTLVLKVVFNGNCDLELLIVSVSNSCNRQCCIGVLYHPPDSNHSVLDTDVNHVLCTMDHTSFSNFVLLGDRLQQHQPSFPPSFAWFHV